MGNSNSSNAPQVSQAPLQWSHSLDPPDSRNRMKKGYYPPRHYIGHGHGGMVPPQKVLPAVNPAKAAALLKPTSNGKILHGGGTISGRKLMQNELDLNLIVDPSNNLESGETESLRRAIRKRHFSASSIAHIDNNNSNNSANGSELNMNLNGGISTPNLTSMDYSSTYNNNGSDYNTRPGSGHHYYKGGSTTNSRDYDSEPDMRDDLPGQGHNGHNGYGHESITTNSMDDSPDRSVSPLPNSFTLISESPAKKQIRSKKKGQAPPPPINANVNHGIIPTNNKQQQMMMMMMQGGQMSQPDSIDFHNNPPHSFSNSNSSNNDNSGRKKLTRLFKTKAQSKQALSQKQKEEDLQSPHLFPHHHKRMLAAEAALTASHMQTQHSNNHVSSSYNSSSQWNSNKNNNNHHSAQDVLTGEDSGRSSSRNGIICNNSNKSEQIQLEKQSSGSGHGQSNSNNTNNIKNIKGGVGVNNNIVESEGRSSSRAGAKPTTNLNSTASQVVAGAAGGKKKKPFAPLCSAKEGNHHHQGKESTRADERAINAPVISGKQTSSSMSSHHASNTNTNTNTTITTSTTTKSTFKSTTPTSSSSQTQQNQSQSTKMKMTEQGNNNSNNNNRNDSGAGATKKTFYFGMDMNSSSSSSNTKTNTNANNSAMAEVSPAATSNINPPPSAHNGNLNKYIMAQVKGGGNNNNNDASAKRSVSEELSITRIEDAKVKRSSNNNNNDGLRSEDRLNASKSGVQVTTGRTLTTPERSESRNSQSHQHKNKPANSNNKIGNNGGQRSSSSHSQSTAEQVQHKDELSKGMQIRASSSSSSSTAHKLNVSSSTTTNNTNTNSGDYPHPPIISSSMIQQQASKIVNKKHIHSQRSESDSDGLNGHGLGPVQHKRQDSGSFDIDEENRNTTNNNNNHRNNNRRVKEPSNSTNTNTSTSGVINFTGESSSDLSSSEVDIPLLIRPTLPQRRLDLPRFSPSAAWRLLDNSPRASGRSLSSEDGFSYEDRIHRMTRPHAPPRQNNERSGDSGISGDAGSPANPPDINGRNSSCSLSMSMSNHNGSSSNNNHINNNFMNMKNKLRKTQVNGGVSANNSGNNNNNSKSDHLKCWTPEQDLDESSSEFEHDGDLSLNSPILLNGISQSQKVHHGKSTLLDSSNTGIINNNSNGASPNPNNLHPGLQTPPKFTTRSQLFASNNNSGFNSDPDKYMCASNGLDGSSSHEGKNYHNFQRQHLYARSSKAKLSKQVQNPNSNNNNSIVEINNDNNHHHGMDPTITTTNNNNKPIIHNVHTKSPNSKPAAFTHGFVGMDTNWFLSRSEPSLDLVTELDLNMDADADNNNSNNKDGNGKSTSHHYSSNKKMKKKDKKRQAKLSVMRLPSEPLDLLDKVFPTRAVVEDEHDHPRGNGMMIDPEDYTDTDSDNDVNDHHHHHNGRDNDNEDVMRMVSRNSRSRFRQNNSSNSQLLIDREVRSEIGYGPSSMFEHFSSPQSAPYYDPSVEDSKANSLILFRRPFSHIMYLPSYDSRRLHQQSSSSPYYLNNRRTKSVDNLIDSHHSHQANNSNSSHHQRSYHSNNNSDRYHRSRSASNQPRQRQIPIEIEQEDSHRNASYTHISYNANNNNVNRKENLSSNFVRSQSVGNNAKPRVIEHKILQAVSSDETNNNNNNNKPQNNNKSINENNNKNNNAKNSLQLEQERQLQEEINNKKKKFKFQSTLRVQERKKIEKELTREAEEKENQRLREIEFLRSVEEEFQRKRAHKENLELELNFNKLNGKTVATKRDLSQDWSDVHSSSNNNIITGENQKNNNNNINSNRAFLKQTPVNGIGKTNSVSTTAANTHANISSTKSSSVITSSTSSTNNSHQMMPSPRDRGSSSLSNHTTTNSNSSPSSNSNHNSKLMRQDPEGAPSCHTPSFTSEKSESNLRKELIHASRKRNAIHNSNNSHHHSNSNASQHGNGSHTEELSEFRQETRQYCDYRRSPRTASPARFMTGGGHHQSSSSDIFPLSRRTPESRSSKQSRYRSIVHPEVVCDIPVKPFPYKGFDFSRLSGSTSNLHIDDRPGSGLGGNTSGPSSIISADNYRKDWAVQSRSGNPGMSGRASSLASLHSDHLRLSSTDLNLLHGDSPRVIHKSRKSPLYHKYSSSPPTSPVPPLSSALSSNISELTDPDKDGSSIMTTTNGPPSGVFNLQPYKAKAYKPVNFRPSGPSQNHAIKLL